MCLETEDALDFVLVAPHVIMKENDAEVALSAPESMLSEILSQITKEDEEYQAELEIHNNVS